MKKLCPFAQPGENAECLGENCAVWVKMIKPSSWPEKMKVYRGCGLIANIPWELKEIKDSEKKDS